MSAYAILLNPGHNRVYYQQSQKLALSELTIAAPRLHTACTNIRITAIADTPYCTFDTDAPIDAHDIDMLSRLSFLFVLFEMTQRGDTVSLMPIQPAAFRYIDDKVTGLLKYKGKTNELFTKMMVNAAWLTSRQGQNMRLLDPMAGRGTTLFEAMTLGMHAYGIDQSRPSVHDGSIFLKKYLETERLKHITKKRTINGANKKAVGRATMFEYANSKEAFSSGNTRLVEMVAGDAARADVYFKKGFFDMIVADLPYGVQHANKQDKTIARSPYALLKSCLPSWHKVLRRGGVVVLAWNTHVMPADEMSSLLPKFGLSPVHADTDFGHFVDASIHRNIIIAVK